MMSLKLDVDGRDGVLFMKKGDLECHSKERNDKIYKTCGPFLGPRFVASQEGEKMWVDLYRDHSLP